MPDNGHLLWLTFTAPRGSQISHIPIGLESAQSGAGQRQGLTEKDREQMAGTKLSTPFQQAKTGNVGKPSTRLPIDPWIEPPHATSL